MEGHHSVTKYEKGGSLSIYGSLSKSRKMKRKNRGMETTRDGNGNENENECTYARKEEAREGQIKHVVKNGAS